MVRYVKSFFSHTILPIFNISLDTIYACQDKKDDAKAGVKSITLLLQDNVKTALFFFATWLVSSWLICGILTGSGMVYFFVTVVGGGLTLAYDLFGVDLDDPKSCLRAVRLILTATFSKILKPLHSFNTMVS